MTPEEYTRRLRSMVDDNVNQFRERVYLSASNKLLGNIKTRIQRTGVDTSGKKLTGYSTKPRYFGRDQFVKKGAFKPVGKNGTKKAKVFDVKTRKAKTVSVIGGRDRKSMYLKGGYAEFRQIQGRQTDHKDYTLSGSTMLSYTLGQQDKTILLGFDKPKASVIRQAHEKKNGGKIYYASAKEMNEFNKDVLKGEEELALRIFNLNQ